jgi:hypothetical protein
MWESNALEIEALLARIKSQAGAEAFRVTQHAQQEMVEEEITLDEVVQAIQHGEILEDYPEHRRGACCLVNGFTDEGRSLHIVCTTAQPLLILITAYVPRPPKWLTPRERRSQP